MGFFRNFANENGKLWGFHLQKPHNLNFLKIMGFFQMKITKKNYGVFRNFANEIRKLWGFSEILQMKMENYGVFICKNPIIRNSEKKIMGFFQMKTP